MDHTEAAPEERLVSDNQWTLDRQPVLEDAHEADLEEAPEPALEEEPTPAYPDPPRTGDTAVDEVIDAVARAVSGPLEEQLAVYDTAYRTLQDRLADVEG